MITVDFKYKLLGFIPYNVKRRVPERWDEVTPPVLKAIAALYSESISDRKAVRRIYNIPWLILMLLDNYEVYHLVVCLDFMSEFNPHHEFIVKSIGRFKAPMPKLAKMTFGQFMFVDTYWHDYAGGKNKASLAKFAAALMLKKNEEFKEDFIAERAPFFEHQNQDLLQALAINYRLVREWISKTYPVLFANRESGSGTKTTRGWVEMFETIVGDDITNRHKYARMNVHEVLRFVQRKMKGK